MPDPTPVPGEPVVGAALFGGYSFPLYATLATSHRAALVRPDIDVGGAYGVITGGTPTDDAQVRRAVAEAITIEWYIQQGKELPVALKKKASKAATKAAPATPAKKAPTHAAMAPNRGVAEAIRMCFAEGMTCEEVLETLRPRFPKLRGGTVNYYQKQIDGAATSAAPEPPAIDAAVLPGAPASSGPSIV